MSGSSEVPSPSDLIRVGILTVSDRCSEGKAEDVSGNVLRRAVEDSRSYIDWEVAERTCVPDERQTISTVLRRWSDLSKLDLILTTGGTGLAERDVTPEATADVLERDVPGIAHALMRGSLEKTPMAMISRLVSGVRGRTLIINFPGNPKACAECIEIVKPVIKHAVDLIRGRDSRANQCHNTMRKLKSKVDITRVARRNRKSPYDIILVEEAQKRILSREYKTTAVNKKIRDAAGFVTAEDMYAKESFPPFRASIKDGYAVITSDGAGPRRVISSSLAGYDASDSVVLKPGECMRVTTGAPIPSESDAVVQVEDTSLVSESERGETEIVVEILKAPKWGQDIREVGSDIKKGEVLVRRGMILTPGALGVLATAGFVEIPVFEKPRVAVLSTGNELQPPDEPLKPGKIRDSNKTALLALLDERGFRAIDSGIAVDDPDVLLNAIHDTLRKVDVLITTGGVSMGERDLLADVLVEDLGAEMIFGRLKMKPGKPTKFFRVPMEDGPKYVFGLPGNPVSAIITSHLLVFPALRAMSGWEKPLPMLFRVKTSTDLKLDERFEYARAFLKWDKGSNDNVPSAILTGNQISSRSMNMVEAECLLHLPAATRSVKVLPAGSIIEAELINPNLTRTTDIAL